MSINTRNRRASCIGYGTPQRAVFPVPDSSLANQGDRQQMAHLYPGILAKFRRHPPAKQQHNNTSK